jgi:hypothetical protein
MCKKKVHINAAKVRTEVQTVGATDGANQGTVSQCNGHYITPDYAQSDIP